MIPSPASGGVRLHQQAAHADDTLAVAPDLVEHSAAALAAPHARAEVVPLQLASTSKALRCTSAPPPRPCPTLVLRSAELDWFIKSAE